MKRERFKSNIFNIIILLLDIILINIGFYVSFLVLFGFNPQKENISAYISVIPFISISTILIFDIYGLYSIVKKSLYEILYSIALSVIIIALITTASAFFVRGFAFPRSVIIVGPVFQFIILSNWRYLMWKFMRSSHGVKKILIIGNAEEAEEIAKKIFVSSKEFYSIHFVNSNENEDKILSLIGDVEEVFLCASIGETDKAGIIARCIEMGNKAYVVPKLYDILLAKSKVSKFDDIPVFQVTSLELTIEQRFVKRAFDFLIALTGLILTLPIALAVAIAIKLDSKGPVFYLQGRITLNNKVFRLIKFRTMVYDAEKYSGPVLASKSDPRITRVGRFIRATRLDELPQFINVLIGDMSFVGPRPERPYFVEQFKNEIPDYAYRHNVKAGITGIAQVQGKYSTSASDKLRYDLMYVCSYSFFLDLKILFQTIKIMFMKESSSGVGTDKSFDELLKEENYDIYSELGVTKIERN